MHKNQWTAVAAALVLGTSSMYAFAQPSRGPVPSGHGMHSAQKPGPGQQSRPQATPQRPGGAARPPAHAARPKAPQAAMRPPAARPPMQARHHVHPHARPPGHANYRGAGPQHQWVKGSQVPWQYRTPHYVVNDWRGHRLHSPPRGYQWVQYGSDYLLVAIASGVIAQLILGY